MLPFCSNQSRSCFVSSHQEGRLAIVMKRGMRCGGRGSVRRATVRRAGGVMPSVSEYLVSKTTALKRTGKTCGPGTQSWCQVFGGFVRLNRVSKTVNPKATVARELSRRGERVINRKTIVWGMPDDPVPRCYSCASAVFLHARPRVPLGIAAFPAPSVISRAGRSSKSPGASHRGAFTCVWILLVMPGLTDFVMPGRRGWPGLARP